METAEIPEDLSMESAQSMAAFTIWHEQKTDAGEDAQPLILGQGPHALLAVFDGMGGAGSQLYHWQNYIVTGARIGAQISAAITQQTFELWLEQNPADGWFAFSGMLTDQLTTGLQTVAAKLIPISTGRLRSKLLRVLPTTFAGLGIEADTETEDRYTAWAFWAGDSRTYILTPNGLCQLSTDNLRVPLDALDQLLADVPLSNCISADQPFYIDHRRLANIVPPFIGLVATDGCFAHLPAPEYFEFLIVESVCASNSVAEWKAALAYELARYQADDQSLALLAVGIENFHTFSKQFEKRWIELYENFIEPFEKQTSTATNNTIENLEEKARLRKTLWEKYRAAGYEHLSHNS
jgi:hypothetical protein